MGFFDIFTGSNHIAPISSYYELIKSLLVNKKEDKKEQTGEHLDICDEKEKSNK